MRTPEQMVTALEDRGCFLFIPHINTQGQVQGSSDDTVWILEMKSSELQPWIPKRGKHASGGRCHTYHPNRRDGPLVVLESHQLQAMYGEQRQLGPGGEQDRLGAVALYEVRSHSVWQGEAGQLLCLRE